MNEPRQVTGTVLTVQLDIDIKKFGADGTYRGSSLHYELSSGKTGRQNFREKTLEIKPHLLEGLKSLTAGDTFTIVLLKNDKGFNDVQSLVKGAAPPVPTVKSTPTKGASGYSANNTIGMIKGNTVTNSVTLAIHLAERKEETVTGVHLNSAANLVLRLHSILEHVDIAKILSGDTTLLAELPDSEIDSSEYV